MWEVMEKEIMLPKKYKMAILIIHLYQRSVWDTDQIVIRRKCNISPEKLKKS